MPVLPVASQVSHAAGGAVVCGGGLLRRLGLGLRRGRRDVVSSVPLCHGSLGREAGAALTSTEMVSAKALVYQDAKTRSLLYIPPEDHPCAAQIFVAGSWTPRRA